MQNSLFHRTLGIGAFSRAARVRVTARTAAPWDGGYGTVCEKLCASVSTSRESTLSREAGGVCFIEKPSGDPTMGVAARDKLSAALPPSRIVLPRRVDHPASSRGRESTGTYAAASRLPPPVANDDLARPRRERSLSRQYAFRTTTSDGAQSCENGQNFHARAPADSLERGDAGVGSC